MAYGILLTISARRDIDALEIVIRKRLGKKFMQISSFDNLQSIAKHMTNSKIGDYRLRVGDYRIVFDFDVQTLVVLRVHHRKDVYQ